MGRLNSTVVVQASGGEVERFFNLCAIHNLSIMNAHKIDIQNENHSYEFTMYVKDYFKIKDYAHKAKIKTVVKQKKGLPFFIRRYRLKGTFLVFSLFFMIGIILLSQRIWRIEVTGNVTITRDEILTFLEEEKIYYGGLLSKIDIEVAEKRLRARFDHIAWTSIKEKGTMISVDIVEGDYIEGPEEKSELSSCDLRATADGTIDYIVVRKGIPKVKKGDTVTKGQILVSGEIQILNDDLTVKRTIPVKADADIGIFHSMDINISLDKKHTQKDYSMQEVNTSFLQTGSSILRNPFHKNKYEQYDVITSTKQLCIFENIYLPIFIGKKTYRQYSVTFHEYTEDEAEKILMTKFLYFLSELDKKRIQIKQKDVMINSLENCYTLEGSIQIVEEAYEQTEIEIINTGQELQ